MLGDWTALHRATTVPPPRQTHRERALRQDRSRREPGLAWQKLCARLNAVELVHPLLQRTVGFVDHRSSSPAFAHTGSRHGQPLTEKLHKRARDGPRCPDQPSARGDSAQHPIRLGPLQDPGIAAAAPLLGASSCTFSPRHSKGEYGDQANSPRAVSVLRERTSIASGRPFTPAMRIRTGPIQQLWWWP